MSSVISRRSAVDLEGQAGYMSKWGVVGKAPRLQSMPVGVPTLTSAVFQGEY